MVVVCVVVWGWLRVVFFFFFVNFFFFFLGFLFVCHWVTKESIISPFVDFCIHVNKIGLQLAKQGHFSNSRIIMRPKLQQVLDEEEPV